MRKAPYSVLVPTHAQRNSHSNTKRELYTNIDIAGWGNVSRRLILMVQVNLPILTTLENCTDFSAALWRSSMAKILRPDSFSCNDD